MDPRPSELGTLGIPHLKDYWARSLHSASPPKAEAELHEVARRWCADNVLLAGLHIGVRETLEFLYQTRPSFEHFEHWVLEKNGGNIPAARIARVNTALRGERADRLETLPDAPSLSPADLAFWDENGYVVLHDAVPAENCAAALKAICEHLRIDLNQPETWYGHAGLWIPLIHHTAVWANRNSPRIHKAFAQLWQRDDLWMNVDLCGVNPPERHGYHFPGTPLHWDVSLAQPIPFGTQAILYLTDTAANQGAFTCVPGFHRKVAEWLQNLPPGADPRQQNLDSLGAIPIPGRAGDLIIWHQALPHCGSPNQADTPRFVQYMNMFPSQWDSNPVWI